jgi:hypothetical protein
MGMVQVQWDSQMDLTHSVGTAQPQALRIVNAGGAAVADLRFRNP